MPAGEPFSPRQRADLDRALRIAESTGGAPFSLYVGELGGDPRTRARQLHAGLPDRDVRVLVAVDPGARRLEIVTGRRVHRRLDDRACALAAATMTSAFANNDLVGGILAGLQMLGEHARAPRTLHTETEAAG